MQKAYKDGFQTIKWTKRILLLALLFSFIFTGTGCYFFPQEEQVLAPPLKEPEKLIYKTIKVKKSNIEKRINATAYFISDLQTDLCFTVRGGRIKSINVKNGDMVRAGDTIIELESDNLENQIKQQQMSLEKLTLSTTQTLSNISRSIKLAELQLEDLERELEKVNETIENLDEGVSLQDIMPNVNIEDMENKIDRQKFIIEGEQEKLKNAKDSAEIDIKAIELQIENLNMELDKTKLISPISGKIVWLTSVNVGENVYTYSNLVRIADVNSLKLKYSGDGLSDFKMGNEVEVKIDDTDYVGVVVMTPATAPFDADDSIKRAILFDVKGLPKGTALGSPARISLLLEQKEDVIVIPRDMLHGFMGQKTVYILEDGVKKDRSVQTGIENPTEVEILKGLEEGEELIEG